MEFIVLILCLLLSACGHDNTKYVYVPGSPQVAGQIEAAPQTIDEKNDDPEGFKISASFKDFQEGKISEQEMVNILFASPSFDHATRIVARDYSHQVRTGQSTLEKQKKFASLAEKVRKSILIRDEQGTRNSLITVAVAVALGGAAGSLANAAIFKVFRHPSFATFILTRGIIPVILSTGIIGGFISGVSTFIGKKTYEYWSNPWDLPWQDRPIFSAEPLLDLARKNHLMKE